MKSVRLSRALARNKVFVRNARTGQVLLKFRASAQTGVKDRLFPPYQLSDQKSPDSFVNLSALYTAEQLRTSNLEALILAQDLELADFD